jgi:hypothetical protein
MNKEFLSKLKQKVSTQSDVEINIAGIALCLSNMQVE